LPLASHLNLYCFVLALVSIVTSYQVRFGIHSYFIRFKLKIAAFTWLACPAASFPSSKAIQSCSVPTPKSL